MRKDNRLVTIILAAGKGKRMKSDLPKVLHPLAGKPLVHYVIELARSVGSSRILLIVGYGRELVINATRGTGVEWVVQEQQLGTGHAVQMCQSALDGYQGDVVVLSGDVPLLRRETVEEGLSLHRGTGAAATVFTFKPGNPTGYGRIIRGKNGELLRIVEQADGSREELSIDEVNGGGYVFRADRLLATLENLSNDNSAGEYYLTDSIGVLRSWGERVSAFLAVDRLELAGVNSRKQLLELENELIRRRAG